LPEQREVLNYWADCDLNVRNITDEYVALDTPCGTFSNNGIHVRYRYGYRNDVRLRQRGSENRWINISCGISHQWEELKFVLEEFLPGKNLELKDISVGRVMETSEHE
jgi:hypothetical protein